MPAKLEAELKKRAAKLARSGKLRKLATETPAEAKNAYVFGTLNKIKKKTEQV